MRTRSKAVVGAVLMLLAMEVKPVQASAQDVAGDPTARLAAVLPADVARHVLDVIKDARADQLPADALANRSLKFAARGIAPQDIARAADEQLARMRTSRDALRSARTASPTGDEIEAGAEAIRQGVSGASVAALAKSAPSGRSLAVPLYVMGSLVSRGLPSDQALQRVQSQLEARASDTDIEAAGRDVAASHRPANEGRGHGAGEGRSEGAGAATHGPPAGVPGNAGNHGRPTTPPGRGKGNGKGKP